MHWGVSALGFGLLAGGAAFASAALDSRSSSALPPDIEFTLKTLEQRIHLVDDKLNEMKARTREKFRLVRSLESGVVPPEYVWEDASQEIESRKKNLLELLRLSIRKESRDTDRLVEMKASILADREWIRIQKQELGSQIAPLTSVLPTGRFECSVSPVDSPNLELVQDFGDRVDKDTGLKWQSQGWWLAKIAGGVRNCAPGRVAFSGSIPNRGRVLMIDHGGGRLTLYANLNDDPELRFKKGDFIGAGRALGSPREKFYFEVRKAGVAITPREVLPRLKVQAAPETLSL